MLIISAVLIFQLAQANPLPIDIDTVLSSRFPGWEWGVVGADVKRFYRESHGREYPKFISGDFNGDGKTDYALKVQCNGKKGNTDVVIAFVSKDSNFLVFVLKTSSANYENYVTLEKRGSRVYDFGTDKEFVLRSDAVNLAHFEKAVETFIFKTNRFERIITGD
jgi:hypothetical protein